jgi:hypothetical protein
MDEPTFGEYKRIVPDAYHGTARANASSILNYGFRVKQSQRAHFGDGVYFFDGVMDYAIEWAERRHQTIAVIRAQIELERCLDLHNPRHVALINSVQSIFKKRGKDVALPIIINYIAERHDVDTVRGTQVKTSSGFVPGTLQGQLPYFKVARPVICVREPSRIIGARLAYQSGL